MEIPRTHSVYKLWLSIYKQAGIIEVSFVYFVHAKLLQSCPTFCNAIDCSLPGSSVRGLLQARILEWIWNSLLEGIFTTQESNLGLPHCRQSHLGSPILYFIFYQKRTQVLYIIFNTAWQLSFLLLTEVHFAA